MPYSRNTWVDNVTQTLAAYLNNIEAGLVAALRGDANLSDLANAGTARTNLGLGKVDNTSDAAKPVGFNIGSGQYLAPPQTSDTITSSSQGTNYMRTIALDLPRAVTVTAIGVNVATAGATGALVRLGIYDDASGVPTNLLLDAGTADTTATGIKEVTISSLAISARRVWLVACTQGAAAGFPDMQNSPRLTNQTSQTAAAGSTAGNAGYYNTAGGISGAFPATFGAVTGNVAAGLIRVYLKVA